MAREEAKNGKEQQETNSVDNKQSKGLDIKIEQIQELLPDRVKQRQQEQQQQNAHLHQLSELKKEVSPTGGGFPILRFGLQS